MNIIAAVAKNKVIGVNNELPWLIPEDLKHFRELTTDNVIVMGRKTFDSLGSLPLPNRDNYVLTTQYKPEKIRNVNYINNLSGIPKLDAETERAGKDLFVIGGAGLYGACISFCEYLFITDVLDNYIGDTHFPDIPDKFKVVESSDVRVTEEGVPYQFLVYENQDK